MDAMEALLRDLRLASRNLLKHRGFTLAALLCLGLGMGASSAIFSVVDAVLLEPLPFAEPDRVVMIWNRFLLQDNPKAPFSGREFLDLESQSTMLEEVALVAPQFVSLTGDGEPRELLAARATAGIFPVLGVEAAVGRVFTPEEDAFGKNDVAVLSHRLWQERFGSDPGIAGKKITIDGRPFLVTGVLPEGFSFGINDFDLWFPQGWNPEKLMPRQVRTAMLAGRLKDGVSLAAAQAEMDVIAKRFERDNPESYPAGSGYGIRLAPAHEDLVGEVRTTLLVLFGAVGLVLAISCLNVANLLVARASSRSKEVAIRTALGSSRGTLVRQFLTEGLLLSLLGAGLGLLLAFWATRTLVAFDPGNIPRLDQVHLDASVLLFTLGLVLVTGVAFGLVPVFHSTAKSLRDPLQDGGKTSAGTAHHRVRSALVVAQVGLAVVVLIGAGLMIKSFRRLLDVDPGFRTKGLLTARFTLTRARYPEDSGVLAFQRQLQHQLSTLSGVRSAALASELPMGAGLGISGDVTLEGRDLGPDEPPPVTGWRMVGPGYFQTLRIPVLQGRAFTPADDEKAPGAVIVEEDLARRLWPGESPLGKRLKLNARTPEESIWRTVVGVVGHVRQQGLADAGGDQLYVPLPQYPTRVVTLVVDPSSASPESLASGVREALWSVDRDLPLEIRTIDQVIDDSLTRQRFNTFLFTAFGVIALTLTVIGVYGVMAYSVAQRTRDVGIRMALGARRADVLRSIVGQGAVLTSVGLALGLAGAWSLSRLMSALLFGVEATDIATFAAVSLLLAGMGLAASYLPARRASKVDPVVALRNE
jgi:putative ABC transport system permease protein